MQWTILTYGLFWRYSHTRWMSKVKEQLWLRMCFVIVYGLIVGSARLLRCCLSTGSVFVKEQYFWMSSNDVKLVIVAWQIMLKVAVEINKRNICESYHYYYTKLKISLFWLPSLIGMALFLFTHSPK